MKGERLSWKEQWVLSEVIWSAFDFSEPSEHFPAIIYLLYASTFNTPDAPREMWGDLFMWKWCHVMFQMKAVCKENDSLVGVCQTSKQYMKGRDGCWLRSHRPPQQRDSRSRRRKETGTPKDTRFPAESTCCAFFKTEMSSCLSCCTFLCFSVFKYWVESVRFGPGCGLVIDR